MRPRRVAVPLFLAALVVLSGCVGTGGGEDPSSGPWFEEVAIDAGLTYNTTGPHTGNGDGAVLVADYDNDGRQDVLAVGGGQPALFHNTGGEFEEDESFPLVAATEFKSGLFFDYDNDGWTDLLLVPRDDDPVFLENQRGNFTRVESGIGDLAWGTGAAAADYDRDGCLDLFIIQNGNWLERVPNRSLPDAPYRNGSDNGNPNALFQGDCETFTNVTEGSGIWGDRWSLATSFVDLNGDGYPDIHVANDYNEDVVYWNDGDGTFTRTIPDNTNRHGMASDIEDVNGDGRPDIFVTNAEWDLDRPIYLNQTGLAIRTQGNNLLVNQGNDSFTDRATEYGVRVGGWGWSGNLVDLDNDGDLDLIHSTRNVLVQEDPDAETTTWVGLKTYPSFWERTGEGSFTEMNASAEGLVTSSGRGLATLDYDQDGDQDVVIADTVGRFKLYENRRANANNWLQVDLPTEDHIANGARIHVTVDGETRSAYRTSHSNFFSQNTPVTQFGLGNATNADQIRVVWPDGHEVTAEDVAANQQVRIHRDGTVERVYGEESGGILPFSLGNAGPALALVAAAALLGPGRD